MIDCHTHIGRNENIRASVSELLKSMDAARIDRALVFASRVGDCPNEYMLSEIAPHRDRLYAVASVHPSLPIYKGPMMDAANEATRVERERLCDWYKNGKIQAVKFYTGYDHYYPSELPKYLGDLEKTGCPVIFHSGDCFNCASQAKLKYAHPLHIDEVAVDFPNLTIVIAHMGFPWVRDAAQVCYKNKNVYADISGFVYGEFNAEDLIKFRKVIDEFLDICPHDKLLFGSDWPISNQSYYVSAVHETPGLLMGDLDSNAQKVFKIK